MDSFWLNNRTELAKLTHWKIVTPMSTLVKWASPVTWMIFLTDLSDSMLRPLPSVLLATDHSILAVWHHSSLSFLLVILLLLECVKHPYSQGFYTCCSLRHSLCSGDHVAPPLLLRSQLRVTSWKSWNNVMIRNINSNRTVWVWDNCVLSSCALEQTGC